MANFTINVPNTIRRGSDGNDTFTISVNSVLSLRRQRRGHLHRRQHQFQLHRWGCGLRLL